MEITEQRQGAVTIVKASGPMAGAGVESFVPRASEAAERAQGRLVLDLSGVPFADSAGIEALLDLADRLEALGRTLAVFGLCETMVEVLELTEALGSMEVFEDANRAVRSFL